MENQPVDTSRNSSHCKHDKKLQNVIGSMNLEKLVRTRKDDLTRSRENRGYKYTRRVTQVKTINTTATWGKRQTCWRYTETSCMWWSTEKRVNHSNKLTWWQLGKQYVQKDAQRPTLACTAELSRRPDEASEVIMQSTPNQQDQICSTRINQANLEAFQQVSSRC